MKDSLKEYIENEILPRYDSFDRGHGRDHALYVIGQGQYLAGFYDVDPDIVYVACACHDLGLREDRKTHHLISGRIIREELPLSRWFTPEEVETIAQAAEDHRASLDHEPRSIYGKIVAEADRQIIPETVIRRTVQFGLKNYPELDKEGHWQRTLEHLDEKYAEGGYLKLWIPQSPNAERLEELRRLISDRDGLRVMFESIYSAETGMRVRKSTSDDVARIMEICADAVRTMRADGNLHQWTGGYPSEDVIRKDILDGVSHVIEYGGRVVGTFAFIPGIEKTYLRIDCGKWIDDTLPYGTIHRLAGAQGSHKVAETCFNWCFEQMGNVRIDTHRDNRIMRHCIEKAGFRYCGIIYLENGDERLAFQRLTPCCQSKV